MKKLALLILMPLLFTSCIEEVDSPPGESTEGKYAPLLMSRAEFDKSIKVLSPQPLINPGKIYIYQNYLFVNETNRGVHIFDNQNPKSPQNIGFFAIPGNVDVAVKNDQLFADMSTDLLSIDISNIQNPKVNKRVKDIFPEPSSPGAVAPQTHNRNEWPEDAIIVGWEKIDDENE